MTVLLYCSLCDGDDPFRVLTNETGLALMQHHLDVVHGVPVEESQDR